MDLQLFILGHKSNRSLLYLLLRNCNYFILSTQFTSQFKSMACFN